MGTVTTIIASEWKDSTSFYTTLPGFTPLDGSVYITSRAAKLFLVLSQYVDNPEDYILGELEDKRWVITKATPIAGERYACEVELPREMDLDGKSVDEIVQQLASTWPVVEN